MTEDEAKTKACCGPADCGLRHVNHDIVDSIGDPTLTERRCIASECMAWQWRDTDEAVPEGWTPSNGYCGLAS